MRILVRIALVVAVTSFLGGCVTAAHWSCDYIDGAWSCSANGNTPKAP